MFKTIQACRAVAAILVVLFHTGGTLVSEKYFGVSASAIEKMFWFGGGAGVAFFFVLSGFIITHVHRSDFDKPTKLTNYLRKRALRIYPTYLILFISVYLLATLTPSLRETMPSDAMVLLKSLLLLPQNKDVVGGTGAPVLGVAWSLQYEILFYSAFAVAIINSSVFYALGAAFLINLVLQSVSAPYEFPRSFFASHLILLFGMGMLTSVAVQSRAQLSNAGRTALCAGMAFFITGITANLFRDSYSKLSFDLAYGAISAFLIFALTRYESQSAPKILGKLSSTLGDSSYALYLIHVPLISILCKLAVLYVPKSTVSASCVFMLIVALCILAGVIFHIFIERPLLRRLTPNYRSRKPVTHKSVN